MNKDLLPWLLGIVIFGILTILAVSHSSYIKAAASHLVISQVQVRTISNTEDNLVELYNPTNSSVDLSSWKLRRETMN